ncbi:ATP-binding cassette domain-containing protein [Anaerosporobacter faecicola]|uniref:ATP-binding cassette domain-containing protein n=1 Tax=Anaerosporobacter faecicola TaxID=2718714 RepID=UPI00143B7459|nr:ABC transporter ATP-binding protein [Anaerosporobacter faecicola]
MGIQGNEEDIIKIEDLSMRFNQHNLFDHTNITIKRGKTIAFLGANGTGKSTLLKIIAGIQKPTKGSVKYEKNIQMNYVPDRFPKLNITIEELLCELAVLDGIDEEASKKRREYYYTRFHMKDMTRTPLKYLSKGSLQKVSVIQALMGKSDLLLMDEPLSGQDLGSQQFFMEEIKKRKQEGITILLACHEPFFVSELADQVYEINNGIWREKKSSILNYTNCVMIEIIGACEELQKIWKLEGLAIEVHKESNQTRIICKKEQSQKILLQLIKEGLTILDYHAFGREEDYHYVTSLYETGK